MASSSTEVQQGCNLGPLCYSSGALDMWIICSFRDGHGVSIVDVQMILACIDEVVIAAPRAGPECQGGGCCVTTLLQK